MRTRGGAALGVDAVGASGRLVSAAFRPQHLEIGDSGGLRGEIQVIENLGHETYVFVNTADGRVCLIVDRDRRPRVGDAVRLSVRPAHVHLFDAASGLRLAA